MLFAFKNLSHVSDWQFIRSSNWCNAHSDKKVKSRLETNPEYQLIGDCERSVQLPRQLVDFFLNGPGVNQHLQRKRICSCCCALIKQHPHWCANLFCSNTDLVDFLLLFLDVCNNFHDFSRVSWSVYIFGHSLEFGYLHKKYDPNSVRLDPMSNFQDMQRTVAPRVKLLHVSFKNSKLPSRVVCRALLCPLLRPPHPSFAHAARWFPPASAEPPTDE